MRRASQACLTCLSKRRGLARHQAPSRFSSAGPTHLHQEVEEAGIESLGQCIASVGCLFHIEGHINGLTASTPFAVHLPTGQLLLQSPAVYAQQVGGEGQDCQTKAKGSGWSGSQDVGASPVAPTWLSWGQKWDEAGLMHEPHTQLSTAPTLTVCALHTGVVPFFTEADVPQVQDPRHELQDELLHTGWNPNDLHGVLWAQWGQLMPPSLVFTLTTELDFWGYSILTAELDSWAHDMDLGRPDFGIPDFALCVCSRCVFMYV